jgi:hypothetical protein
VTSATLPSKRLLIENSPKFEMAGFSAPETYALR